jgi:hypothetical protein
MQHRSPVHTHFCSELVDVITRDKRGPSRVTGNLEEIGEWNALVLTEAAIERGTNVRVACESKELTGVVESCVRDESLGFFVEVRLDPESRWSEQWFTPRHLLSLCAPKPEVFHLVLASGY